MQPPYARKVTGTRPPRRLDGCVAEHTGIAFRFWGFRSPSGSTCSCATCFAAGTAVAVLVAHGCGCRDCAVARAAVERAKLTHSNGARPEWSSIALEPTQATVAPLAEERVASDQAARRSLQRSPRPARRRQWVA